MEDQIKLLLLSYSLEEILEDNDLTEEYVLSLLIEQGEIDLERYFNND